MTGTAHDLNRERHWTCARRLSERRHDLGLTQAEVVDRLTALGATASNRTLSAMEHGQGVDVGRLPELAVALDCTITYLLGLTDDPMRWQPDDLSVAITVDITAPASAAAIAREHGSWILGPDVPDRHVPGQLPVQLPVAGGARRA
jgi:transcriptional regulator with XRE-family HTH domain